MKKSNVIIIIIDTLRKDYSKDLNNFLSKLNFKSFKNVYATSSWTMPSQASIMTCLYPSFLRAHETKHLKGI